MSGDFAREERKAETELQAIAFRTLSKPWVD
jgi:hypothetical protein